MNYQDAKDTIKNRETKKLGNNTYLVRAGEDFAVKLHSTNVVTIHADGTYTLNSGGWQTVTTKERINSYSPARISQQKGIWYMQDRCVFYDGVRISATGTVVSQVVHADETEKLKKKLDRMVSVYISGFIAHIKANGLQEPSSGDCWACCLKTDDGKSFMGLEHILNHFEEKYYVPSLLWNALQRRGNPGFCWGIGERNPEFFRSDLQYYFRRMKPQLLELMKESQP